MLGENEFPAVDRWWAANDNPDAEARRGRWAEPDGSQHFYDRFGDGDLDGATAMFATSVRITDPGLATVEGLEALRGYLVGLKGMVPDARAIVERTFELDDTLIVEGRFTGTGKAHSQAGGPAGAKIDLAFADFTLIRDDRIIEYRTYYDQVSLLTQLGQSE